MADVKDGNRTSGASPEGTEARVSLTQPGKPVQDNNDNSDTESNWKERYEAQRELTRKLEAQKNEALKERDALVKKSSAEPKTDNNPHLEALTDMVGKLAARFEQQEKTDYVKKAVAARGLPEELAEKLHDVDLVKIDAILDAIPAPKKPVPKPDKASVTISADAPAGPKTTYTETDLKAMSPEEVIKAFKAGNIVDSEGNSITKQ